MERMDPSMGGQQRSLPVYLLIDCSSSMSGAPIIAVSEGLKLLYNELMRDPLARESVWISLIRFATTASQDPLAPIDQFVPPMLTAHGSTAMGGAIQILVASIKQDLISKFGISRSHYRPLVFLLTDGTPTDDWQGPVQQLKALTDSLRPNIIALGCGNDVDAQMLSQITPDVLLLRSPTPDHLMALFKWISSSIVSAESYRGTSDTVMMAPGYRRHLVLTVISGQLSGLVSMWSALSLHFQ